MANGFGYTFSPSGRNRLREQNGEQGSPKGSRDLGRALQVLSLRLPRVTGGGPIAPDDLLRSMGGPGPVGIPAPTTPMGGPPVEPMAPAIPPSGGVPPPPVPPIMTPPSGNLGPLATLVGGAVGGTGTPAASTTAAPKQTAAPASPKKKKKTTSAPNVRGGVPSLAASSGPPRVIPGLGGGPIVDDPLGQASQPFVPEMQEAGGGNPLGQSGLKTRWADKYEMDPSMFNNFLM